MNRLDLIILGASLLLFVISPYIPNMVLNATVGSSVGILVLLLAPLFVVRYNPVLALAVLLAVGALFLENRKRILTNIKASINTEIRKGGGKYAPLDDVAAGAPDLIDGEVHPEHETPFEESHAFQPEKDSTDSFQTMGESINEKGPLATVPTNSSRTMADHFEKAGLT
jgi:hypothetical protein